MFQAVIASPVTQIEPATWKSKGKWEPLFYTLEISDTFDNIRSQHTFINTSGKRQLQLIYIYFLLGSDLYRDKLPNCLFHSSYIPSSFRETEARTCGNAFSKSCVKDNEMASVNRPDKTMHSRAHLI